MPWNGLVGQHMQGRVCLQSWPLLGPFGRLLADFLRYSYYNRTITVLSYENRTFPYYNRTTTLRTNPVRPHATGPYQPRTTKARFLRNCPLCKGAGATMGGATTSKAGERQLSKRCPTQRARQTQPRELAARKTMQGTAKGGQVLAGWTWGREGSCSSVVQAGRARRSKGRGAYVCGANSRRPYRRT